MALSTRAYILTFTPSLTLEAASVSLYVITIMPGRLGVLSYTITLTPYMVLPLFATRFADYAGGIREVIRQYDSCNTGELDRHAQHQQPCLASRTLRVIVRQEQPVLSGTHWSSFAHRQMSVVLCLRRFPMKIENCHIRHQRPLKVHQRPPR